MEKKKQKEKEKEELKRKHKELEPLTVESLLNPELPKDDKKQDKAKAKRVSLDYSLVKHVKIALKLIIAKIDGQINECSVLYYLNLIRIVD